MMAMDAMRLCWLPLIFIKTYDCHLFIFEFHCYSIVDFFQCTRTDVVIRLMLCQPIELGREDSLLSGVLDSKLKRQPKQKSTANKWLWWQFCLTLTIRIHGKIWRFLGINLKQKNPWIGNLPLGSRNDIALSFELHYNEM